MPIGRREATGNPSPVVPDQEEDVTPIRIAIHGAAGRMGQRLIALGKADPGLSIVAALENPGHARLGDDAGVVAGIGPIGVMLSAALEGPVDVVIDFSVSSAADRILDLCRQTRSCPRDGDHGT